MYGYQNYYGYQPGFNQVQPSFNQPSQDERIWVQGEGAAQSYLVAANGFVRLWDSQQPVFYEKRADATGKPYMESYEYKPKSAQRPNNSLFNDKGMIEGQEDIKAEIDELRARIGALETKRRPN